MSITTACVPDEIELQEEGHDDVTEEALAIIVARCKKSVMEGIIGG